MKHHYGKNVFLTGGSSGIGLATAKLLAENGFTVFAASRNPNAEVRKTPGGGEIRPVTLDVRDPVSVDAAVEYVLSQADIGVIIHSAGIGIACPAEESPSEPVERLMDTNFTGVLHLNSRLLPHLRSRGKGLCLMIGSVAGLFPIPFQSHYSASKAALDSYAAAMRMEMAGSGVRVSLVLPGDTNTGFTSARTYEVEECSVYYEKCVRAVRKMEKDEIGGRKPESVARIILKLCSKARPPLRTIVGFDYKFLAFLKRLLPYCLVEAILKSVYMGR